MDTLQPLDRAKCRLVSKKWFSSVCALYERKEKICITGLYNDCLDEVWSMLSRTARSYLHLEFLGLDVLGDGEAEMAFWKACGQKILSLKLCSCRATSLIFDNVLRYCSNLETLELHFPSIGEMMKEDGLSIISLRRSVRLKLRNTSLRTLKIRFKDKYKAFPDSTDHKWSFYYLEALCQLFTLLPCVSNFSSSQRHWIEYSIHFRGNPAHVDEKKTLEYMAQLQEYFAGDQMKNIAIPWLGLDWNVWSEFMEVLGRRTTNKITEIIVLESEISDPYASRKRFWWRQENIQKVACIFSEMEYTSEAFKEAAHQFIESLESLPSVRHLWLTNQNFYWYHRGYRCINEKIKATSNEIQGPLSTSPSHTIMKGIAATPFVESSKTFSPSKPFPVLPKLTSCKIDAFVTKNLIACTRMLSSFPNLTDLYLGHANEALFKSVGTKPHKLESFIVDGTYLGERLTATNFVPLFRNLKYLKVPQTFEMRPEYINNLRFLQVSSEGVHVRPSESARTVDPIRMAYHYPYTIELPTLDQYLTTYQSACPHLEVACFDLDYTPSLEKYGEIVTHNEETTSSIRSALAKFVANLKNLKYLYFKFRSLSNQKGPYFTEKDALTIFEGSRSLRMLITAEDQIFFRHAMKNSCIIHSTMQNVNINATEFLELFGIEDERFPV